jgi:hypothetical protein
MGWRPARPRCAAPWPAGTAAAVGYQAERRQLAGPPGGVPGSADPTQPRVADRLLGTGEPGRMSTSQRTSAAATPQPTRGTKHNRHRAASCTRTSDARSRIRRTCPTPSWTFCACYPAFPRGRVVGRAVRWSSRVAATMPSPRLPWPPIPTTWACAGAGLADHGRQPGQDHSQRVPAQPTAPGGAGGAALQPPTTGDGRQGAHGATWKAAWARTRGSNGAWSTGVGGTRTWKWEGPAPMRPRSFSNSRSSPGLIGYHEVPTHDPHPQAAAVSRSIDPRIDT